jgi:hypothetical protein
MDADVIRTSTQTLIFTTGHRMAGVLLLALTVLTVTGCEGRTLVDDNPVFASAPPRKALVNSSSVQSQTTPGQTASADGIRLVALESSGLDWTKGNLVVAEVNGKPIFVDDIVGGMRLMVVASEQLSADQKQQIIRSAVQRNLADRIDQEIVLSEVARKIPEDRQDAVKESMEESFQAVIAGIKKERKLDTDEQLDDMLAAEGQSIALLRESYFRMQMVNGYLFTLAEPPKSIARKELVAYYQTHKEEYTPEEQVKWQELVVRFASHGGQAEAEKRMVTVVQQLQAGADFGTVAGTYSDSLSAERQGDMGWLKHGGLADQELESLLFELPVGGMTKVFVRDDRFEVFRVTEHQLPTARPFSEVQLEIEELLKQQKTEEQRRKVMADLKERSSVSTVFDQDNA